MLTKFYGLCIFIWFISEVFFKFSTNIGYKHHEGKELFILRSRPSTKLKKHIKNNTSSLNFIQFAEKEKKKEQKGWGLGQGGDTMHVTFHRFSWLLCIITHSDCLTSQESPSKPSKLRWLVIYSETYYY